METLLQGIPYVSFYLDDILITGTSVFENLRSASYSSGTACLHLKQNKCAFLLPVIEQFGHKISAEDLQPIEDKVRAIKKVYPQAMFPNYVPSWGW